MTRQDHSDMVKRAVTLISEEFTDSEQPSCWPRQQPRTKGRQAPQAIFVHAELYCEEEIDYHDVVVHAIEIVTEESALIQTDEDEQVAFPALDSIEKMPGNYRWLVMPEDIIEDDDVLEALGEECSSRGIGMILSCHDEDYDEIFALAEPESGEYLQMYEDAEEIMDALNEQVEKLQGMDNYDDQDENIDFEDDDY